MKKKKVLIVYHFVALYRESIFEELSKSKLLDITFACDSKSKENIQTVNENFFSNKKFIKLENYWYKNILWQKRLISISLFSRFDVVIFLADPNFLSTWITSIIFKIRNKKILFWTHGFLHDNSLKNKLKTIYYKLADGLLLYGKNSKNNLLKKGFPDKKLFIIYNSLNYALQKKLRERYIMNKKEKIFKNSSLKQIIFIGRLTKQKKLEQLIYLVKELEKINLKINLLFVGEGEEKKTLEKLVSTHNLEDRIYFYGKTYNEDEIAPLIMSSNICISPGEIGLTAMHVLGYGIPIITHNSEFFQMPEYEAVIPNKTGYLFKKDSFDSLVEVTIKLLTNPIPNVKNNCIEVIEKFYTPQRQVEFIENTIFKIYN